MAFALNSAGDNFNFGWNMVAKVPKGSYSSPAVGDLVILDSTTDNGVDILAANTNPYGIVTDTNNGTGILTVAEFVNSATIVLPYSGSVARGDKVEGDGTTTHNTTLDRMEVRTDNVNGVGTVIAVDAGTPYGTGFCTVRF